MAPVLHIVMSALKPEITAEQESMICDAVLALKDQCVRPETKQPYIKSIRGGRDHSIEGLQNGFTHVFVMEFESKEDRDYYVNHDPVHLATKGDLPKALDKLVVLDFTPGQF